MGLNYFFCGLSSPEVNPECLLKYDYIFWTLGANTNWTPFGFEFSLCFWGLSSPVQSLKMFKLLCSQGNPFLFQIFQTQKKENHFPSLSMNLLTLGALQPTRTNIKTFRALQPTVSGLSSPQWKGSPAHKLQMKGSPAHSVQWSCSTFGLLCCVGCLPMVPVWLLYYSTDLTGESSLHVKYLPFSFFPSFSIPFYSFIFYIIFLLHYFPSFFIPPIFAEKSTS